MFPDPHPYLKAATVGGVQGKAPVVADPWDAPYFGGQTYFHYQPSLIARAVSGESDTVIGADVAAAQRVLSEAASQHPAYPWDAPYFGAPVYFSYSSQVVPRLASAPSLGSSNSSDGKQSLPAPVNVEITSATRVQVVAGASTTRKRNWLARLFGSR